MSPLAKRVVGGLLAFVGLLLTATGLWYAAHLGSSGSATFSAAGSGSTPIVVPASVLNRVDSDARVTAVPRAKAETWIGSARPSDVAAVLGKTGRQEATGVSTRSWSLALSSVGTGKAPALAGTDVWRNAVTASGTNSMTIRQAEAPESVVIQPTAGEIDRVEVTWERGAWFVQAVVCAVIGLLLLASGLVLVWTTRRVAAARHGARPATQTTETPDPAASTQEAR